MYFHVCFMSWTIIEYKIILKCWSAKNINGHYIILKSTLLMLMKTFCWLLSDGVKNSVAESPSEVCIFATDSDSVPYLQQIYNRFLIDHRFKIGCKPVNDNFGQQPIYNRIYICELTHRLKFGCKSVVIFSRFINRFKADLDYNYFVSHYWW